MDRCAIIATHHKCGTSWMNATFRAICARLGIRFANIRREPLSQAECTPPMVISVAVWQFAKLPWLLEIPHRMLHLIRDPRDVVISGMHYHLEAREEWLHQPSDRFGGQSYQQALQGLPDDHARYLLEMDRRAGLLPMANWTYGRKGCFECRYEDLMQDIDMSLFTRVVKHLGFSDEELETCRAAFWSSSLFGGQARRVGKKVHTRSGAPRQWTKVFTQQLAEAFVQRHGDTLLATGYEPNHDWVRTLARAGTATSD